MIPAYYFLKAHFSNINRIPFPPIREEQGVGVNNQNHQEELGELVSQFPWVAELY